MNLRGARRTRLVNTIVDRKPIPRLANDPPDSNTHEAIEVGCTDAQPNPGYEIIDSEIDMEGCSLNSHRSPGVAVLGCGGNEGEEKVASLLIRDTDFKLDLNVPPCSEETPHLAFDFSNLDSHSLNFETGTLGNRVITTEGASRPDLFARFPGSGSGDGSGDGSDRDMESPLFKGVFGLKDGRGWGMRQRPDPDGFEAVLESLNYWASNQCVDPDCVCQLHSSGVGEGSGFMNSTMIPDEMNPANCTVIPPGYERVTTTTEMSSTATPTTLVMTTPTAAETTAPDDSGMTTTVEVAPDTVATTLPATTTVVETPTEPATTNTETTTEITTTAAETTAPDDSGMTTTVEVAPDTVATTLPATTTGSETPTEPATTNTETTVGAATTATGSTTRASTAAPTELPTLPSFTSCGVFAAGGSHEDSDDHAACQAAMREEDIGTLLDRVIKIPHTYNRQNVGVLLSQPNTLYIFDSYGPADSLNDKMLVEYDLPTNFTMPDNSGLVGNLKMNRLPEITFSGSDNSAFVIRANNGSSQYLFAHIEVDSRESMDFEGHQGVLDLKGAGGVILRDVKIVRNAISSDASSGQDAMRNSFSAIELGCTENMPTPSYQVIDSEIDIIEQVTFPDYGNIILPGGPAFLVEGCGQTKTANLTLSGTTIKITESSTSFGERDFAFGFDTTQTTPQVVFAAESTCNHILDADNGDISATHLGQSGSRFTGLLGLVNGKAWGVDDEGASSVLMTWCDWRQAGRADPSCRNNGVTVPACPLTSPTVPVITSTFLTTPDLVNTTAATTVDMAATTVVTTGEAEATTAAATTTNTVETTTESMTTVAETTTGAISTAGPTEAPTLPSFTSCTDPGLATEDQTVCSQARMEEGFETLLTQVIKIPHTYNRQDIGDILSQPNTLYIFDSDGPVESLNSDFLVEYGVMPGFQLPANSGLVGNNKGTMDGKPKRPEITLLNTENCLPRVSECHVLRANNAQGSYLLANIEIDSKGDNPMHTPDGVLDVLGARKVTLNNVKIVRDPAQSSEGHSPFAVYMGCSFERPDPSYTIRNSEIDLRRLHSTVNNDVSSLGDAFFITGCFNSGATATVTVQNTDVVIDDSVVHDGELVSSGVMFHLFNLLLRDTHIPVVFTNDSRCNRVINTHEQDISAEHMGTVSGESPDVRYFSGLVGLTSHKGWGMVQDPTDNVYRPVLQERCDWLALDPNTDPVCMDSSREPSLEMDCPTTVPDMTTTMAMEQTTTGMESTITPESPETTTEEMATTTATSTVAMTTTTPVTTEGAATTSVVETTTEAATTEPSTLPSFNSCTDPRLETEDQGVCTNAMNETGFEGLIRHVIKIPHTRRQLRQEDISQENTLYLLDSNVTDDPDSLNDEGLVEYDLPANFTMPANSALVGNSRGGKSRRSLQPQAWLHPLSLKLEKLRAPTCLSMLKSTSGMGTVIQPTMV